MNMKQWVEQMKQPGPKKSMPVLSFPCISLMGITVKELIADSALQAKGMKAIADRHKTLAAVSMMDLSVEAEAFGAEIRASEQLRGFWKKYQRDFDYAKDISFDDACDTVRRIMDSITE